jgi:lipopolysaccharide export LptBFGC system permease protein LptF
MLIFTAGLLGVVLLPFLVLMVPVLLWLGIPTAVFFGAGYALKLLKRHNQPTVLLPLHRS